MPITQALNSKANVKKQTSNDLPFAPQQPVIARYAATSTLNQTVINLTFSVDQSNTDIFWLFVDGKKLELGSGNDFTFTSLAPDNTSSQVTLTVPLSAGLNIEAYKLGLKKESEFQTDNRFVNAYEALNEGFQGFVKTSTLMTATAVTGTPAAGTFYSTITNRASIQDLSQDLKARMGVDRISVQSLYEIQNEFGPNGERVFGALNDSHSLTRFVGAWSSGISTYGQFAQSATAGDYAEITFYGTGLNLLTFIELASKDIRVSIDGGAESGNIWPSTSTSSVIAGRNYSQNVPLSLASGLTLGIHTVKIRYAVVAGGFGVHGFEILNESSSVKINLGVAYVKGQKYTSTAQSSFLYSAPVTGTRGGRVLVYQNADGTIGKAFQATDAAQANLSSASHTNEEIIRTYHWREFGAGRTDDFSTLVSSGSTVRAFTLDDGTTDLILNANPGAPSGVNETLNMNNVASTYTSVTFVGTGLDVEIYGWTASTSWSGVRIDGPSIGAYDPIVASGTFKTTKIVSGLPYGTHVVRLETSAVTNAPGIRKFIVYGPKKPTLPSGAVELADYNVMADFVPNTTAPAVGGGSYIGSGVLRKQISMREAVYVGTWSNSGVSAELVSGNLITTTTAASYVEYTFFGIGFELRPYLNAGTATNFTLSVDGSSNLSGFSTNFYTSSTGMTFTPATGVLSGTATVNNGYGTGISVNGLTLGKHTIRVTHNSGTTFIDSFEFATPIHSSKSNLYADLQNTLPVGSCAISDNRKLSPLKDSSVRKKIIGATNLLDITIPGWASTSSTAYVPRVNASLTLTFAQDCRVQVAAMVSPYSGGSVNDAVYGIFMDGNLQAEVRIEPPSSVNRPIVCPLNTYINISKGTHKFDIYYKSENGVALNDYYSTSLIVIEID